MTVFFRGRGGRASKASLQATSSCAKGRAKNRLQQEDLLRVQWAGKTVDSPAKRDAAADNCFKKNQKVLHWKSWCTGRRLALRSFLF